jgi:DNA-binding MarR family transcriptional regulator
MTKEHDDGPHPRDEFARALRGLALAYQRYRARVYRERLGVGFSDGALLGSLRLDGPSTAGQLATRLNLSTPSITEVLDRMERAGHVVRSRHPTDRRKIVVTATETATKDLDVQWRVFDELVEPVLDSQPESVRALIIQILVDVTELLDRTED